MTHAEFRFDVFGQRMAVARRGAGWVAWWLGPDGKRRPADVAIPDLITDDELCQFLADLFHESATAAHDEVTRLP